MTEAEIRALRRYVAVGDGYDADLPHMVAKFRYLIDCAHNRHHRTMRALMEGREVSAERISAACAKFNELLNAIETPTP